jgi:hypothetical protein
MNDHHLAPSNPAVPGGIVFLRARLSDIINWVGPIVAAACGVIASGGLGNRLDDWARLALLILLVDGAWGTLWAALSATDWATPLRQWRRWQAGRPLAQLPYTQPDAPGYQMSLWLGQLRAWWAVIFWPSCEHALSALAIALPLTVLFSLLLGESAVLLSLGALAFIQLAVAWGGGQGHFAPTWDGVVAIALPWLGGQLLFGELSLAGIACALLGALAYGTAWHARSTGGRIVHLLALGGCATLLVTLPSPLAAGAFILLLVPQISLLPWLRRNLQASWYVRRSRPWLLLSLLVLAFAI